MSFHTDVIHTVGPQGEKPALLKSAYESSLNLMLENQLRSVVSLNLFPLFRYSFHRHVIAGISVHFYRDLW